MPFFDLTCPVCGKKYVDHLLGLSEDLPLCEECQVEMEKEIAIPARMNENWSSWQRDGSGK